MQMLQSDWLSLCTLSDVSVHCLGVVDDEISTSNSRFTEVTANNLIVKYLT